MKLIIVHFFCIITLSLLGQENAGRFIKDARTGCMIWDEYYAPEDSISWEGKCKDKLADGSGTLIWYAHGKETARYAGSMLKGNPNGKGKYIFVGAGKLEGNFVDGVLLNLEDPYLKRLEKNKISIVDSTDLYVNDGKSQTLFYYALVPKGKIKGALVLLPSTDETPEEVFSNNVKLTELACDSNLLTIIPSINSHVCLDNVALDFLNTTFAEAIKKYKIPSDKFVIGGLSLGGMLSLRYTEQSYENSSKTTIVPIAVFGADPPVDLSTLYYQFQRDIERNYSQPAVSEAKSYLTEMNKIFGGSPNQHPEKYVQYSMYSRSKQDGGNAKFLKAVPVRIYSDPDIDWQMKNKHRDYYDLNAPDQTAMINELHLMGNNKAEFINSLGKGFRLDGTRHPHSWSIVDAGDTINWIMKYLE